nr:pentatricopeptide repeat-containing protein At5g67570, chloroplastic [Ipomoea batatas]
MEVSAGASHLPKPVEKPDVEKIKQKLLQSGVVPTPKIIHTIRKKQLQKLNRRLAKKAAKEPPPLTDAQKQTLTEESHFQAVKSEYKRFNRTITAKNEGKLMGRPWERLEKLQLQEFSSENKQYFGDKLKDEPLRELGDFIESERDKFRWLLDADVEIEEGWFDNQRSNWVPPKRRGGEAEAIRFLINKLSGTEIGLKNYKFSRMMKHSGLQFTERQMLRLVEGLGDRGQWRHALSVVEWVYNMKEYRHFKSRFVYTKLLAVLGKSRRPHEALQVFSLMRGDAQIYPDMAAYHSVSVTLGQAGLLKELIKIIDCMKEKPKKIKNMRRKNWDPVLLPDIVVYNAVLNACVPSRQWRGVFWVFQQLRKNNLKPTGATYGLAMEVMLQSGKYDLVHEFFEKMKRSGNAVKAITYKVLVKTFWEEGKVNEAIQAAREMEQRGVVGGTACVYYELACCLCYHGNLEGAFLEIEKLRSLRRIRPLAVTFTGMILSSMDGGHINNCISIYEHSKNYCEPDIGIINAMLKVYGRNDMFLEAKELYELTKKVDVDSQISLSPDIYTFSSMLEASARALQWEYFESVYKEMSLVGYQLDQKKHAYLLVDASKAGKGHLLDHAFDTILEAGVVPHQSFFTEILCNATSQCDYERVFTIINMLAIAPFQISEQEWVKLFDYNRDRIMSADLQELLETQCKHGSRTEPTILNLYRALQSLCGVYDSSHTSSRGDSDLKPSNDGSPVFITSAKAATLYSSEKSQLSISGTIGREDDEDSENEGEWELVQNSSYSNDHGEESVFPNTILEHFDEDDSMSDDCFDEFDELNVELPGSEDDEEDSHVTEVPSAHEILESWKEMKKKNDFFSLSNKPLVR